MARFIPKSPLARWKRIGLFALRSVLVVAGCFLLVQLFYPADRALPFARVDGIDVGGHTLREATSTINTFYANASIPLVQQATGTTVGTSHLADLGVSVTNASDQVSQLTYPLWLRLIPTSLLWAHSLVPATAPEYDRNVATFSSYSQPLFASWCAVPSVNASLAVNGSTIDLTPAQNGISCTAEQLLKSFATYKPTKGVLAFSIPGSVTAPAVSTDFAKQLHSTILSALTDPQGIPVETDEGTVHLPNNTVLSWLQFSLTDTETPFSVNADAAGAYFDAQADAQATASNKVLAQIDAADFSSQLTEYLSTPTAQRHQLKVNQLKIVGAIDDFLATHSGTYKIALIEPDGLKRHVSYNGADDIITASTYKMYEAFSIIKAINSGEWSWDDPATEDYSVSDCFDLMLEVSDNTCAEAMLDRLTMYRVQSDAQAIGATSTTFAPYDIHSTANDEALLLSKLQTGQLPISSAGAQRWISTMKLNEYRSGIPSGIPSVVIADKVGFQDELLHDAAIVYSPKGTYILVILTADASWDDIAELARVIEAAR